MVWDAYCEREELYISNELSTYSSMRNIYIYIHIYKYRKYIYHNQNLH